MGRGVDGRGKELSFPTFFLEFNCPQSPLGTGLAATRSFCSRDFAGHREGCGKAGTGICQVTALLPLEDKPRGSWGHLHPCRHQTLSLQESPPSLQPPNPGAPGATSTPAGTELSPSPAGTPPCPLPRHQRGQLGGAGAAPDQPVLTATSPAASITESLSLEKLIQPIHDTP